jgi:predicted phosphodiesterase
MVEAGLLIRHISRLHVAAILFAVCFSPVVTAGEPLQAPIQANADYDTVGFTAYEPGPFVAHMRSSQPLPISDEPLFVFATIADSHIRQGALDDLRYLKAFSICRPLLSNYVADINAYTRDVEFVVHLGDITDLGRAWEFAEARAILDSLDCELYPVVGNHDNFESDNKQRWKDFAGMDSTNYSFDYAGYHFVVIDCTMDPYEEPYVDCDSEVRTWVAENLASHSGMPTIVFSHYNLWEMGWNARFDTTGRYAEYEGMPELRQVLEQAGNVIAVVNGHVHANRMEVHNGIQYISVGATLVGPPSVRYFYMFRDRIEVTYAYISDDDLYNHAISLCPRCTSCFDSSYVCDFIDGAESDKQFTIYHGWAGISQHSTDLSDEFVLDLAVDRQSRSVDAAIISDRLGPVEMSLYDVQGRQIDRCTVSKTDHQISVNLSQALPSLNSLSGGVYFVRVRLGSRCGTAKIPLTY